MNTAGGRLVEAQQVTHQGGLSRATAAHDDHDFTRLDIQVDALENRPVAIMRVQVTHLYYILWRSLSHNGFFA